MIWIILSLPAALAIFFLMISRGRELSETDAAQYLRNGAHVIDVRSPAEFTGGHLADAINIPLGEVEAEIPRRFPGRKQALLLHCASGMRSGLAQKKLQSLGYTHAFNLGSFNRAEQIVRAAK